MKGYSKWLVLAALALPLVLAGQPADNQRMGDMPGMDHGASGGAAASDEQSGAMGAMSGLRGQMMENMMKYHMKFTADRKPTPEDQKRADEIVASLKAGIEKYKDYKVALSDGYKIFHPESKQPRYHFTNYKNAFASAFGLDAANPTSLLYKKTKDGYELIGAMYTAPKRFTEDQLNERIPLSIGHWHEHTNVCLPQGFRQNPKGMDWRKFGPGGSIYTADDCAKQNGTFLPVIYSWMIHVYPYEPTRDRIWAHDPMTDPD